MTATTTAAPSDLFAPVGPTVDDVAARLLSTLLGTQELLAVYAGERLGWYRALDDLGAATSGAVARRTATAERYVREWLEHQAGTGLVTVEDVTAAPDRRLYGLTPGAREVLLDVDSPTYLGALPRMAVASGRVVDELLDAFRTGGGVPWERLGADAREAQAALNRPFFLGPFVRDVVPALPDLCAALRRGARVADVGCGEGWSSIAMARAFPASTVTGVDLDSASVAAARRHAAAHAVEDRVRFVDADATTLSGGPFDVVTAFECVHDMGDPVGVLAGVRAALAPGGYVLVMDEAAEPAFTAPAGPLERLLYGYSLFICLPDGLAHPGGVGTGTVLRAGTLTRYAEEAGFARVEVLPVAHEMFRFYRLHA